MIAPLLLVLPVLAAPGWRAVGPERGQLLDADAGPDTISVVTRVGVLTAGTDAWTWRRDGRFPLDTRRVAIGPDGVPWAATAGSLWRLPGAGEAPTPGANPGGDPVPDAPTKARSTALPPGHAAVDLVTTGRGTLLAAVRGPSPKVLRVVDEGGVLTAEEVLDGVDPWCLASRGEETWLGTTASGLWRSTDDGRTFERVLRKGGVTALGVVGDRVLAAFTDGRLVDASTEAVLHEAPGLLVTAIAADGDTAVLTLAGPQSGVGPLATLVDGTLTPVEMAPLDGDEGHPRPSGAWALPSGQGVLIGTSSQGPATLRDGALAFARAGFQATVGGGAAIDDTGRLLLGLMGTGVYLTTDGGVTWKAQTGANGPVTDAVAVVALGTSLAVLDFDGVALLDPAGTWKRVPGTENPNPGRRSGLQDLTAGAGGAWWGLDTAGQLWQRLGSTWTRCADTGGFHLDGQGDAIYLATGKGMLRVTGCAEPNPSAGTPAVQTDWSQARAAGPWLATPGALWRDGRRVSALPPARITALATRDDRVLLGLATGEVLECAGETCAAVGSRIPGEVAAVGWLPDGRAWAAERRGTLLVAEGDQPVLPWSDLPGGQPPDANLQRLESPPWQAEGQAGGGPGHAPPPPAAAPGGAPAPSSAESVPGGWLTLAAAGLVALAVGIAGLWKLRR